MGHFVATHKPMPQGKEKLKQDIWLKSEDKELKKIKDKKETNSYLSQAAILFKETGYMALRTPIGSQTRSICWFEVGEQRKEHKQDWKQDLDFSGPSQPMWGDSSPVPQLACQLLKAEYDSWKAKRKGRKNSSGEKKMYKSTLQLREGLPRQQTLTIKYIQVALWFQVSSLPTNHMHLKYPQKMTPYTHKAFPQSLHEVTCLAFHLGFSINTFNKVHLSTFIQ